MDTKLFLCPERPESVSKLLNSFRSPKSNFSVDIHCPRKVVFSFNIQPDSNPAHGAQSALYYKKCGVLVNKPVSETKTFVQTYSQFQGEVLVLNINEDTNNSNLLIHLRFYCRHSSNTDIASSAYSYYVSTHGIYKHAGNPLCCSTMHDSGGYYSNSGCLRSPR